MAGVAAACAAFGVSELLAGLDSHVPSLIGAVGDAVIAWSPAALVRLGITTFGHADKAVVVAGILVSGLAVGALLGRLARRQPGLSSLGFATFGLVGIGAVARDPQAGLGGGIIAAVVSVLAGTGVLRLLLRIGARERHVEPAVPERIGVPDRRAFLGAVATVVAASATGGGVGRRLAESAGKGDARQVTLAAVDVPVESPTSANMVGVTGVSPVVMPNKSFYRIDTRLLGAPRVDLQAWRLRVRGMVERPFELTWNELNAMPMEEVYVTLSCVSNEVGGDLVGNAAWRGVPLDALLRRAGVQHGADQIVGRAVDGFTVGFPTSAVSDGRHALVAVGMNGEPLPRLHGFPARLVVAGLYGYVSATKWLKEIELTTFNAYDAYWIQRGWAQQGPIKTQSRIDTVVPKPLVAGPATVAGVAWAPTRGIRNVEVQLDDGVWKPARLATPIGDDAWRQWALDWTATPGLHVLRVRATDGHGQTQTGESAPPPPDGATGYHTVRVDVSPA